ncbi:MAG: exodeoxyribonuclease I [Aquificaceae bacterium]|nr:MAG: exodeoxyribonuclease I [Aquificaceae bacterium]
MAETTLLWHDYETWGVNPRKDRPSQFAAIRTTLDLEPIGKPIEIFCKPSNDFIPHPEAILVTGITPQRATREGIPEAEFFQQINDAFSKPGTCGVGYNSIRFDDEVTRFGFYRNFIDPYAREWQNGNSRWDILDLVRMTYALRPEGIEWPIREDGTASFRLEDLTTANGIEHAGAHDALVDVRATIEMARLIKKHQPRLFDYYFSLRKKNKASELVNAHSDKVVLHVSGMFPASQGCISPIYPLLQHPTNQNEIICFDLRQDPELLLSLSAEDIAVNLYTPYHERKEGDVRVALKGIHLNKSPALSPTNTLSSEMAEKWQIDWAVVEANKQKLVADKTLVPRLQEMYQQKRDFGETDADSALYNGFINASDRRMCNQIIKTSPESLASLNPAFSDIRLETLFPRYRARNWPETLAHDEQLEWQEFCHARLVDGEYGSTLTVHEFNNLLEEISQRDLSEHEQKLMQELVSWVQQFD